MSYFLFSIRNNFYWMNRVWFDILTGLSNYWIFYINNRWNAYVWTLLGVPGWQTHILRSTLRIFRPKLRPPEKLSICKTTVAVGSHVPADNVRQLVCFKKTRQAHTSNMTLQCTPIRGTIITTTVIKVKLTTCFQLECSAFLWCSWHGSLCSVTCLQKEHIMVIFVLFRLHFTNSWQQLDLVKILLAI